MNQLLFRNENRVEGNKATQKLEIQPTPTDQRCRNTDVETESIHKEEREVMNYETYAE